MDGCPAKWSQGQAGTLWNVSILFIINMIQDFCNLFIIYYLAYYPFLAPILFKESAPWTSRLFRQRPTWSSAGEGGLRSHERSHDRVFSNLPFPRNLSPDILFSTALVSNLRRPYGFNSGFVQATVRSFSENVGMPTTVPFLRAYAAKPFFVRREGIGAGEGRLRIFCF